MTAIFSDLKDKNVLVTGANRGIGRAIAISLWESEEAMLASESSDYMRQQVEEVGRFLEEAAPSTTSYRVSGTWLQTNDG